MSIVNLLGSGSNKWKSCKYEVNIEIKFSSGTTRTLKPAQITGLYCEKDYDNDHHPILMLDVALSKIDSNAINDETEFHIRINQFYKESENGEKKDPKIYLNDTFVKLNTKSDANSDSSTKIEKSIRKANQMTDDDVAPEDLANQETIPLVKKDDQSLTKKMINGVLSNVSQLELMAWMLSKAGCRKPMMLSNFTNPSKLSEVIVHPKTLLANLLEMEKEYGWHQEGTYIFFDYNMLYVTRMNGLCTAWAKNEPKTVNFCISDASSSDNVPSGVLIKDNAVYYNIGLDQYQQSNASSVSDQVEGNNMLLINTTNGGSSNVSSGVTSTYGSGSYNTKTYHGHNPYEEEQYKRRKLEQENQIKFTCLNGDISFLTPNKEYKVVTDVTSIIKNFSGNYRLSSFKASFVKNGDYFDSSTEIVIKRVSK
jgi:hypothetical protein